GPFARSGAAQLLDRYVYRTHANYQRTVREASTVLTRVLNMDELLSVLTTTLRQAIRPEGLAIYAAQNAQLVRVAEMRPLANGRFELPDELPRIIADSLAGAKDAIATDHYRSANGSTSEPQSQMQDLNWAAALP